MKTKLLVTAAITLALMVSAAYFGGDAFKGVQAAPPIGATAHRFDHSKVEWNATPATDNSPSQSVGANDD
jgi:hypothetical protein